MLLRIPEADLSIFLSASPVKQCFLGGRLIHLMPKKEPNPKTRFL